MDSSKKKETGRKEDGSTPSKGKTIARKAFWWLLAIAMLIACLLSGCSRQQPVKIGITPQMSGRLIGWMVRELAEKEGIECEMIEVPGGITNLQPPLESGNIQIGVEHAQAAWETTLNKRTLLRTSDLLELQRTYESRGLVWNSLPMTQSVYTFAIRKDLAIEQNLSTLSDLAKVASSMTLGAPTQYFEDADGYPWMSENYGISFQTTRNLPEDLLVDAIRNERVDVIPIHTIDGLIQRNELVIMEDDLDLCTSSGLGLIIEKDTLLEYPAFLTIIDSLARTLTSEQLAFYGRLVTNKEATEQEAALQFLKTKDLIIETPQEALDAMDEFRDSFASPTD